MQILSLKGLALGNCCCFQALKEYLVGGGKIRVLCTSSPPNECIISFPMLVFAGVLVETILPELKNHCIFCSSFISR